MPSAAPTPQARLTLADSSAFKAGQQHMARRIAEMLRQRRREIEALPVAGQSARQTLAIRSELAVIIRAVDALTYTDPQG